MPKKYLQDLYFIFNSIEPDEYGCHNYPKAQPEHYYSIMINWVRTKVHRLALERKLGRPIKPGFFALHLCDNKSCVNPDHLYEGTDKDNQQDRMHRYPESFAHLYNPSVRLQAYRRSAATAERLRKQGPKARKARWDKYRERKEFNHGV